MSKGDDTRQAILTHAARLSGKHGLEALTIGRLAAELGMSKSGLFSHFGSKESLQIEVLELLSSTFRDQIVRPAFQEPRGEPRIRALFENWLQWEKANDMKGGCPFVQVTAEFDDQPGPVRDLIQRTQRVWLDGLAESARMAMDEGHFRADTDTTQFAFEFYSLLLGYHHAHRMMRDPAAEAHVRAAVEQLLAKNHP
jgi:AcrR family transcriptional regulator